MTMTDQAQHSITAFFDEKEAASEAVEELVKAGFPRTTVKLVSSTGQTVQSAEPGSFWDDLKGFFLAEEDRHSYARAYVGAATWSW
jgi:hypothetical protein